MREIVMPRDDVFTTEFPTIKPYGPHRGVKRLNQTRRLLARQAARGSTKTNVKASHDRTEVLRLWLISVVRTLYVALLAATQDIRRISFAAARTLRQPIVDVQRRVNMRERKRNKHARLNAILFLVFIGVVATGLGFFDFGLAISFNGEQIGFVAHQEDFDNAVKNVSERISLMLNQPYQLEPQVAYHYSLADARKMLSQEDIEQILYSSVDGLAYGYTLTIDGVQVGACRTRDTLDALVAAYKAEQAVPGAVVDYASTLEIAGHWVNEDSLLDAQALRAIVETPLREALIVVMDEDDTVESLAAEYGMTAETLLSYNAALTAEDFSADAEIIVNPVLPLVSMATTVQVELEEVIPFEIIEEQNGKMYQGETKITQSGAEGVKTVVYDVRSVNGVEDSRTVVNEIVTQEPVTEIRQIGTKERPTYIRPYNGIVTSQFGWRVLFGAANYHTGVDFAGPKNAPIVAVAAGTVTYAGWKGTYGNCVMIDHGGGLVTLYAHNNSLLVYVGQKVSQGQQIAKMGTTGKSTGNHCHIEFILNGKPVNPWNYLK